MGTGLCTLGLLLVAHGAQAKTYEVGKGKEFSSLSQVDPLLKPGDVVEVQGDAEYESIHFKSSGTKEAPIRIVGIRVAGNRPIISGGDNTVILNGSHTVFEGFEVTGGSEICVVHKADDVTIRDVVVHDCAKHGILGTDFDSGTLLIEYAEVYNCGEGQQKHQIYIATDETKYPGSVFRLQFSYIHDGNGGNNVKSRAERNEIYYNWIEGAVFHELDLIGPDGQDENLAIEDSDIVGNVLIKTSSWQIARVGGDGTGQTFGHYRFVNNTFLLGDAAELAVRLHFGTGGAEFYNNIFYRPSGGARVWRLTDPVGPTPYVVGSNNWVQDGWTEIPGDWTNTIQGADPGFEDLAKFDLRPKAGSPLIDKGTDSTSYGAKGLPAPLMTPAFVPPFRARPVVDKAWPRTTTAALDIGAFEFGSDVGSGPGPGGTPNPPTKSPGENSNPPGPDGTSGSTGTTPGATAPGSSDDGGCGCRMGTPNSPIASYGWLSLMLVAGALGFRYQRRTRT
jgi:hypothetical protein